MAFTQAQLAVLEAAIASGTRTVQYQDRTVTYHSLEEMLKLRRQMKDELAGSSAEPRFRRTSYHRE